MARRRFAGLAAAIAIVASGVLCAAALADDPLLALTTGGQLVRFDAGTPGSMPQPVTPSGLRAGEKLIAIGNTGSFVQALADSGQLYSVDLETDAVVARTSPLAPAALLSGVGIAYGPLGPSEVVLADGSLCSDFPGGCGTVPVDAATGQPAAVIAAAVAPITGPPQPLAATPRSPLYGIDGVGELVTLDEPPYGVGVRKVGALGVPVAAPAALAVARGGARGFLISGSPTQSEYSLDLASGATTLIGPLGPTGAIRSMTTIPPATITQNDPVTGAYPVASTGPSHGPVTGVPNPALEGRDPAFAVPVNRAGDPTGAASVQYAAGASNDPAAGVDYLPVSGAVSFAPGQQRGSFSVVLLAGPARPAPGSYVQVGLTLGSATGAINTLLAGAMGYEIIQQPGHPPDAGLPPLTATSRLLFGLVRTQTIAVALRRGLAVPVTCPLPCTVKLTVRAAQRSSSKVAPAAAAAAALASRTLKLARAGTYVIHLRLNRRGRRTLRGARSAALSVSGQARFASGAGITGHSRLTLVRRSAS